MHKLCSEFWGEKIVGCARQPPSRPALSRLSRPLQAPPQTLDPNQICLIRRALTDLIALLTDLRTHFLNALLTGLLTDLLTDLLTGLLTDANKQVIKALLALVIHAPYNRLRRGLLAEAVELLSGGPIF